MPHIAEIGVYSEPV